MPYELHRSAIITGNLNCFCLVCECLLASIQESLCHIKTSSHCENLSAVPYLDKFQDQYIRKFKTGYYCEFCNKVMQTTVHVNLHIGEEWHQQNRGTKLLKPLDQDVTAFNNVLIQESAWHGLIDNVCCICATEFEDEVLHKKNNSHILNLIQRPVKFGENDVIYGRIDDSNIHCMTCNKFISSNTMTQHFDDADHLDLYSKCKIGFKDKTTNENDKNEKAIDETSIHDEEYNKNEINSYCKTGDIKDNNNDETETVLSKENITDVQFNNPDFERHIEEYSRIATSAEDDGSKLNTAFEIDEILHIKGHNEDHNEINLENELKNDPEVSQQNSQLVAAFKDVNNSIQNKDYAPESGSSNPDVSHHKLNYNEVAKALAIDNNMTFDSSNAFCRTCQVKLPFNLKSMKEHIKGVRHNKNLITKVTLTRQSMEDFIHLLLRVRSRSDFEINSVYLINDKYCITLLSHVLLTKNPSGDSLKCLICGITLLGYPEVPVAHIDSCSLPKGKHIQIITSEKDEYIREIRPEQFHCGFCHIVVVGGWSEIQRHLRTPEHDRQKLDLNNLFRSITFTMKQYYLRHLIQLIDYTMICSNDK